MIGITLKNGLVSYYGNPAGYIEKEIAVVDSIFQNDELSAWMQSHALTPQWTDGVTERLLAGGQTGAGGEPAAPLKHVRIWQLKPETDVYKKFISLDEIEKQFGGSNPADYRISYDGQLDTNDLNAIYTRCNVNHPPGYNGHSLSMSDVVELYDASGSEYHYCDRFGFKQISFQQDGAARHRTDHAANILKGEKIMPEAKTISIPAPKEKKQHTPLQYDVNIYPSKGDGALRANAAVNLNGQFAIRGLKIMEGSKGLFVSMPSYRTGNGEYKDICFPCTKEARTDFDKAVMAAYQQKMEQSQTEAPAQEAPWQEQGQQMAGI